MQTLNLDDYDYALPEELIAKHPLRQRTKARLLKLDRKSGIFSHQIFSDLPALLKPGDLLVFNNTKVIPARLLGKRKTGGKVEVLLLEENQMGNWKALVKPGGKIKKGDKIHFKKGSLEMDGEVMDDPVPDSGERTLHFSAKNFRSLLSEIGWMPIPPYLGRNSAEMDFEDYQTIFAETEGAVAAPTAGLHFDEDLLQKIKSQEIETAYVTLHVGYGTFQPILETDLRRHQMHRERYEISEAAAEKINRAKAEGRRVIACGTTVVRTVESAVNQEGKVVPGAGTTQLFIYSPFQFRITDALITNFHLSRSSLLLLVAAFAGREKILKAYQEAIRHRYRFYSYGDGMLIL